MTPDLHDALLALKNWCHDVSIVPWSDAIASRFQKYLSLLLLYQHRTNLTGFHSTSDLVQNGIIDSLQILRAGPCSGPLLDIGSGAGLPAIPLLIVHPEYHATLVEPRAKRYAFLRLVQTELALDNCEILHTTAQQAAPFFPSPGLILSRAFAPLDAWIAMAAAWLSSPHTQIGCYTTPALWNQALTQNIPSLCGLTLSGLFQTQNRLYALLQSNRSPDKRS